LLGARSSELTSAPEPHAARAEPLSLSRTISTAQGFETIGLSCLRQITQNEDALRIDDPEAVHQMRVALRRLRAAISLFKDLLDDAQIPSIKAELRWISEQLGPARDYDVFVNDVRAMQQSVDAERAAELRELESVLQRRRDEAFIDAKAAINSERYRSTLATTEQWLRGGAWRSSADPRQRARRERRLLPFARALLTRRVKKLVSKLDRLEKLDPERRHRVRIAVKKLNYGAQFFASLFPSAKGRRKRFTEQLKQLQEALGKLNDISVRSRLLPALVDAPLSHEAPLDALGASSRAAHALGLLSGHEDSDVGPLTSAAVKGGSRLAKLAYFWA